MNEIVSENYEGINDRIFRDERTGCHIIPNDRHSGKKTPRQTATGTRSAAKNLIIFHADVPMYYYQRLKDLREDADKSQAEIARILEISQQHYSQYERGERELPMHLFIALANYYNASLDYMAGRTNNKGGFNRKIEK